MIGSIGRACLAGFAALGLAAGELARAESPESPEPAAPTDTVVVLPEIRVDRERARSEARRRQPTGFVAELTPGAANRAFESIAEVLAEGAGLHVTQYGGLGAFSTVSLRGAPAGQVAVYLDGAPLTSAGHAAVNLADLPATAIERVEIYRGASPLGLGSATPGGAINLITAAARSGLVARLSAGSFGSREGRASWGGERGGLSAIAHAGYQGARGDFRYFDDNGTPQNAGDDAVSTRQNARFDATSALLGLTWQPRPQVRVQAREDFFQRRGGVPGQGATPALNASAAFERALTHLDAQVTGHGFVPTVQARSSLARERSRFLDTEGQLGLGRSDQRDRLAGEAAELELEWPRWLAPLAIQTGALWRTERANTSNRLSGYSDPPPSRRYTRGASVGAQLRPFGERLTLHAARRWDRLTDHLRSSGVAGTLTRADVTRELNAPQVGAHVALPRGVELRANWSKAQRAPEFLELFGNQGSVLGNPKLKPERAETWDAGGAWTARRASGASAGLEWAHFATFAEDLIVYQRNSASTVRAQNVARARIHGEELSVHATLPRGALPCAVEATVSATWQSALDDGPFAIYLGKRLPQRPGRQSYARLGFTRDAWRLACDAQYLGDNMLDPANFRRAESRTLIGASLSYAVLAERFRFTAEGKNLGDRRVSDVGGFPLPGRSVFVSCETRFGGPVHSHP